MVRYNGEPIVGKGSVLRLHEELHPVPYQNSAHHKLSPEFYMRHDNTISVVGPSQSESIAWRQLWYRSRKLSSEGYSDLARQRKRQKNVEPDS